MFKRIRNAKDAKDKSNTKRLEVKLEKALDQTGKRNKPTSVSVQSPNDKMSIIGEGVIIEGKICGSGNLIINGMMKGDVDLDKNILTVGPKGRIEGEFNVKNAVISGQLNGKVNALKTVNIKHTANVCGEIKAKSISIDEGAFFNGNIELVQAPSRIAEAGDHALSKTDRNQNKVLVMPTSELDPI